MTAGEHTSWELGADASEARRRESIRLLEDCGPRFARALSAGAIEARVHRLHADKLLRSSMVDEYLSNGMYRSTTANALRLAQVLFLLIFVVVGFACHPGLGAISLVLALLSYRYGLQSNRPDLLEAAGFGRRKPVTPGKWSKDYGTAFGVFSLLGLLGGRETLPIGIWMASMAAYLGAEYTRFTAAERVVRRLLGESTDVVRLLIAQDVVAFYQPD